MSQKQPKPTLGGQRIKTRKRDEKVKHDPLGFRDDIISGLEDAKGDLDQVSKFLDSAGAKLNYRLYGEHLFDILFAGGVLAPGGSIVEEVSDKSRPVRTSVCVFAAKEDSQSLNNYVQLFHHLIRRYKYLQKAFEEDIKKLLLFLKGFQEEERNKLAVVVGFLLANGMAPANVLTNLFNESLVKSGLAIQFVTRMFQVWLKERDISAVSGALKKADLENKLQDFMPPNRQTAEHFDKHFTAAGLEKLVGYQRIQMAVSSKRQFSNQVLEMIKAETPVKEVIQVLREEMKKDGLKDEDVVILIWKTAMTAVEWNKKEELIKEQALKYLKFYAPLFAAFTSSSKAEMNLIIKVQEYCYANMIFMKVFQTIILLFYKTDVLSEDVILKWHKEDHSAKGKSVFSEQMTKMVEWLQSAEEESESEGEEEDE